MAADAAGNALVTGYFSGTASFGPTNLTTAGFDDIFFAKYDGAGNLLWVRQAGGNMIDVSYAVAAVTSNLLYATGSFASTAKFGSTNLASAGLDDVFVSTLGVVTVPALHLTRTAQGLRVTWPASAFGFALYERGTFAPGTTWQLTSSVPVNDGVWLSVTVTNVAAQAERYFELRKP